MAFLTKKKYLREVLGHELVFNDYHTFELREKAYDALKDKEILNKYAQCIAGDRRHAFMGACCMSSIKAGIKKAGWGFISQETILASAPHKDLALTASIAHNFTDKNGVPYTLSCKDAIIPDQLFGIDYGDGDCRFFAVEFDRGTMPLTRKTFKLASILKKLLQYKSVSATRAYSDKWGIPNLYVIFITTHNDPDGHNDTDRADHMVDLCRLLYPKGSNFMLFKAVQGFQANHRTPKPMPFLFTDPYKRTGEVFWLTKREEQPVNL